MPDRADLQNAEPGEESLRVILGALTERADTLRWPTSPGSSGTESRPLIFGTSSRWAESPKLDLGDATTNLVDVSIEPAVADAIADATTNLTHPSPQMAETSKVAGASLEADPVPASGAGPGASIEDAARPTGRSGVRPVQVAKRHPGTTVLAAGALVALAGGAVLGGWTKPVSVSLPGTHTILVDPSSHSDKLPGTTSKPATTSTAHSTAIPSRAAPPSSVANAPTGTPVTGPAPSGSPSRSPSGSASGSAIGSAIGSAGSGPSQGTNSSSSTTPSAGTSSTGASSDTSGTGGGSSAPPPSSGSPPGATPGGGSPTPTPPPVTTPPTTPPTGGPGSSGLAAVLAGVFGSVFGSK